MLSRNQTIAGLSSTASYTNVFEEVSKYNVHLNLAERLWAVRTILATDRPTPFAQTVVLTRATVVVPLDAE